MNSIDLNRAARLIEETVRALGLDLSGLRILTEAGTGPFVLTPVIALMAGAERVHAWTRDSAHGLGEIIRADLLDIVKDLGLASENLEIAVNERPSHHVRQSNIITNSGLVRPIDRDLLSHAEPGTAVALMFEAWEWRDGEVDKNYCEEHGIHLGGTWENYPPLRIFDQCGQLCLKILFEAGQEVFGNTIIVWSGDDFGTVAARALEQNGAIVIRTTDAEVVYDVCARSDAILFCDYHEKRPLIGVNGILDPSRLRACGSSLKIVHLLGQLDAKSVEKTGLPVFPEINGEAGKMTFTLAHLGLRPVIQLQAAGLKVGESLYKRLEHPICQTIV